MLPELKFASLHFDFGDESWEHKHVLRGDECLRIVFPNSWAPPLPDPMLGLRHRASVRGEEKETGTDGRGRLGGGAGGQWKPKWQGRSRHPHDVSR